MLIHFLKRTVPHRRPLYLSVRELSTPTPERSISPGASWWLEKSKKKLAGVNEKYMASVSGGGGDSNSLAKQMSSLTPLVERYNLYEGLIGEIGDLYAMLEDESEEEMVSLARLELEELSSLEASMAVELQAAATKSYAKSR
jgi:hypothetical protein